MNNTKRVALYARVSTKNNGQDPETQLLALRDYSKARRLEVFSEYVDVGISGSKDSRPALNRLMADARKRRFDAVLVARFDRFARSTRHLV
ncbi:MAG: recombinase family protein [Acidobacteria bacterium]|nr:recombinase family protein [Acidobacteriota bacterium]